MGQKTHPIGFRLGIIKTWTSKWYEEKNYAKWLHEDIKLKKFIKKKLEHAGVAGVEIERAANKAKINIHTARPGIVIGKRGAGVETLKKEVQALTENEVFLNIQRGPQGRDQRAARRGEHRDPARAPRRVPPRHEEGGADGDEVRRQGHPRRVGGPPGRRRDGALRVVPRGSRAAAHAARRHRVRVRRGQHDVRQDRRASAGSSRARCCRPRAACRAAGTSRLCKGERAAMLSPEANQVPQDAEGPHARPRQGRRRASRSATSACRRSRRAGSPRARSRRLVSP